MMFAVLASAMSFAAVRGGKNSNAADAAAVKIEEWKREVKKLEAAPVAEGFVKWKGFDTIKSERTARWLAPSDLRGRFVIIVDIDAAKATEQLKATLPLLRFGFNPGWNTDWDFEPVKRDVIVVYNLHDFAEARMMTDIYENEALKQIIASYGSLNFYGFVTFDGAPESQDERPFVYVMGPEGTEPIYKGKFVAGTTYNEINKAIEKAAADLPAWRPWYGYVAEVKHTKGFDAAVAGGKGLAPFLQALKKGIVSKKPEVAAESQRLYDALEQHKGDLMYAIKKEFSFSPCAALYDIEELTKRFPALKRDVAKFNEKFQKQHPNIMQLYKHYALFRRCANPGFQAKSAAEAKKLAVELEKARPILTKLAEDAKDVAIQNMAVSLLPRLDDVIAGLPEKVMKK